MSILVDVTLYENKLRSKSSTNFNKSKKSLDSLSSYYSEFEAEDLKTVVVPKIDRL